VSLSVTRGVDHINAFYRDIFRLHVRTVRIDADDCETLTRICMLSGSILRIPLKKICDKICREYQYEYYRFGVTKDGRNITDLIFYLKERE